MACLYCGKEIGAFRLLRGDEFCSTAHRKLYGKRLGKAFDQIREPQLPQMGIAGFSLRVPPKEGNRRQVVKGWQILSSVQASGARAPWPVVEITPLLGFGPKPLANANCVAPPADPGFRRSPKPVHTVCLPRSVPSNTSLWLGSLAGPAGGRGGIGLSEQPTPAFRSAGEFTPTLRLPGVEAIGRVLTGLPAGTSTGQKWLPLGGVAPVLGSPQHSGAGVIAARAPELPSGLDGIDIGDVRLAGAKWQRTAAAAMATVTMRAKARLIPERPAGPANATPRYPELPQLHPSEDLLKDLKVADPAGPAALRWPTPMEAECRAVALEPSPADGQFRAEPAAPSWERLPLRLATTARLEPVTESRASKQEPAAAAGAPWVPALEAGWPSLAAVVPLPLRALLSATPESGRLAARSSARPALPLTATVRSSEAALAWVRAMYGAEWIAAQMNLARETALAPAVVAAPVQAADSAETAAAKVFQPSSWEARPATFLRDGGILQLASPTALADFASGRTADPVNFAPELAPPAQAVLAETVKSLPLLPDVTRLDLAARPVEAPAIRYGQAPKGMAPTSRSAVTAIGAPALQLPKFRPASLASEVETVPLVPRAVAGEGQFSSGDPSPLATPPAQRQPRFSWSQQAALTAAGFHPAYPEGVRPEAQAADPDVAVLQPISSLPAKPEAISGEAAVSSVPLPGFVAIEFYCQRATGSLRWRSSWNWRVGALEQPMLNLPLAPDREEPVERVPEPVASTVTEIFSHPEAKLLARRRYMGFVAKIAACLILALFTWFGVRVIGSNAGALTNQPAEALVGTPRPVAAPGPATPQGVFARTFRAIAGRATVEVQDTFHGDMQAWGSAARGWAPGWSRNAAGYVHPGDLALFNPSRKFQDYRLDFFGQIENKGLGWVMRGQDKQNYYAMKFQVIQDGLRPVVAMVHYPVVDGKKGHRVETPLSVMFHRNQPFHVSVEVSGNRFTASVDGEKIESWTDDMPRAGAAGFFSEASERARLYWMKVTKNDDFLGSICALLAGDAAREVANAWGPETPGDAPRPSSPERPADAILAEAESANDPNDFSARVHRNRPGGRILQYGRKLAWNL